MKNLVFIFAATLITICASAQADSLINFLPPDSFIKTIPPDFDHTPEKTNSNTNDNIQINPANNEPDEKMITHPDGVLMLNGKMMIIKGGRMTKLKNDIIMSNGTKVQPDGTIMKVIGNDIRMKEGDHMDFSGKMLIMKNAGSSSNQLTH